MLYGDSATCRQGVGQGDRKENHLVGVYMRGNLPGTDTGLGSAIFLGNFYPKLFYCPLFI